MSNVWQQRTTRPTPSDNPRAQAALGLLKVSQGQSLNTLLTELERPLDNSERGFLRDLLLGSCRYWHRLNAIAKMLLDQPFEGNAEVLHSLLIVGLYQLEIQQKSAHAAVHATVDATESLGFGNRRSIINACLRRYLREQEDLLKPLNDNPVTASSHPKWLVKLLKSAWPEHWQTILQSNNQPAPLCLRNNSRQQTRAQYQAQLQQADIGHRSGNLSSQSIYLLTSQNVTELPGFADGSCSVQDEAAQLAAELLAPQSGERILDACAAPGGKTCHLAEQADIRLTAVELEAGRIPRIHDNLARLKLQAEVIQADASQPDQWWDGEPFDAILLDAPCSATGVIRRHPDIKLLRRRDDIDALVELQQHILTQCWSMLKPGGRLLYATCSVLPQENSQQIQRFLETHDDAGLQALTKTGNVEHTGLQLLPTENSHDGFYYALLTKTSKVCQ